MVVPRDCRQDQALRYMSSKLSAHHDLAQFV